MSRQRGQEIIFKVLMLGSLALVAASLVGIVGVVLAKGAPALSWDMVSKTPTGGFYLGGGGGILNAIVGSLLLAVCATALAFVLSIAIATVLQREFTHPKLAGLVRTILELLWGIPSIVYGVFCFIFMVWMGIGTSLLAGIIALTLLEIPIMTRVMDEAIGMVDAEMKTAAYVLGANRVQTAARVVWRQALPGIASGILLAFGRGIGDAASILFTAGFTDYIPRSLNDSAAALPTMIFFLSTSPIPEVRERAYAAAFLLLAVVLIISIIARFSAKRSSKYIIK